MAVPTSPLLVACAAAFCTACAAGRAQEAPAAAQPAIESPVSEATAGSTRARPVPCEGREPAANPRLRDVEIIRPGELVPSFDVATTQCQQLHSEHLVGKTAFALVFFSSWCGVCEKKLPMVQAASRELGAEIPFYGVVLDDEDTWDDVAPYMERLGLQLPIVRGTRFRRFALGYNPYQSVPTVVIVGRNGYVVDLQVGYSPFDYSRLIGAGELAKKIPTDFKPPKVAAGRPPNAPRGASSPGEDAVRMPESAAEKVDP